MTGQRFRLVVTNQARQQFKELRRSIASVSGSEVTARNYMSALTDYRLFAFKGVGGVGIRRSGGGSVGGSFGG